MKSVFILILALLSLSLSLSTKVNGQECPMSTDIVMPNLFYINDCSTSPIEHYNMPVILYITFEENLPVANIQIKDPSIDREYFTFYNVKKDQPIGVGPFYIYKYTIHVCEIFETNINCGFTYYIGSPNVDSTVKWLGFIEAEVLSCDNEGEYFVNIYCRGNVDKFEAIVNGVNLGEYTSTDIEPAKIGPINANNIKGETEIIIRSTEDEYNSCSERLVEKINVGILDCAKPLESAIKNIKCDYRECDYLSELLIGFTIRFHNFNPSETGYALSINGEEPVNYKYAETGHSNRIYLEDLKAQDFYFTITDLENPNCTASYFYENNCIDPYECSLSLKTRKIRQTDDAFYIEVALSEESENVIMLDVYVEDEYKFTKDRLKINDPFVLGPFDKETQNQVKLKFQGNMKENCLYEATINAIDKPNNLPDFSGKTDNNQSISIYQNNHELIIEAKETIHTVALYDLNGKIIASQKGVADFFNGEMFAIPKNIISGIYIVRIVLEGEVFTRKILID